MLCCLKDMMSSSSNLPILVGVAACAAAFGWYQYQGRIKSKKAHSDNIVCCVEPKEEVRVNTSLNPIDHFEQLHTFYTSTNCNGCIYLDYNGTTPVFPEVYKAMIPFLTTCFGNPSSSHMYSRPCREGVLQARKQIGQLINAVSPLEEIYFTGCGTESDNRAIDIALHHFRVKNGKNIVPHVITNIIEHPAILNYLRKLFNEGLIELTVLGVSYDGVVSVSELQRELRNNTALVTIMHSNNEVGTIQPIREIAGVIKQFNRETSVRVLLHTDAAQSISKVVIDVASLGVDMMTIVGHKYGAPKGIACLYIKQQSPAIELCPMLVGGGQERGTRGGTENVAFMVGLGEASRIAHSEFNEFYLHLLTLRLHLLRTLRVTFHDKLDCLKFNGPIRANDPKELESDLKMIKVMVKNAVNNSNSASASSTAVRSVIPEDAIEQLPNTVSVSFKGVESHEILVDLANKVACTAGSACHAAPEGATHTEMSPVLKAMHIDPVFGLGTLRLSFGRHTTVADINVAVKEINRVVREAWSKHS